MTPRARSAPLLPGRPPSPPCLAGAHVPRTEGRALPSIGIFRSPVAICTSYDPYSVPCAVP